MSSDDPGTITPSPATRGHSAEVPIDLFIGGQRLPVAQIGRDQLIFDEPVLLPAPTGQLVLNIDGQRRTWQLTTHGAVAPARIISADFRDEV